MTITDEIPQRTEPITHTQAEMQAHLGGTKDFDGFEVAEALPIQKPYEIGRAFLGCDRDVSVLDKQRNTLQAMIDRYGAEINNWSLQPEIRQYHNHEATLTLLDFGRKIAVERRSCQWAAYAIVFSVAPPVDWYVPEGVRITNEDIEDPTGYRAF